MQERIDGVETDTMKSKWIIKRLKRPSLFDTSFISLGFIFIFIFTILPIIALVLAIHFDEFIAAASSTSVKTAIQLSLFTTLIASVVCLVLGLPLAYLLARRNFRGKRLIDTVVDLPMVLPPSVAGLSLILLFGRYTKLGSRIDSTIGIQVLWTWKAIILAQIFVAGPFLIRSAKAAFESVPVAYENAARSLGASKTKTFFTVTLPLSKRGIFAGWILMWLRAMGEFGATLMVTSAGQTTMPVAIYRFFFLLQLKEAIATAVILLVIAYSVLAIVRFVIEKGGSPT